MIAITIADGVAEKELLNSLRQRSGETDKKVTASVTEILDSGHRISWYIPELLRHLWLLRYPEFL